MTSTVYRDPHGTSTVKFGTAVYRGYREYRPSLRQSARMSKIKNGGLDQYGAKPFQQQQFGIAGV